jgi:hypothetical protein
MSLSKCDLVEQSLNVNFIFLSLDLNVERDLNEIPIWAHEVDQKAIDDRLWLHTKVSQRETVVSNMIYIHNITFVDQCLTDLFCSRCLVQKTTIFFQVNAA